MLCCVHLDELKKYDARPIIHYTLFLVREMKRLVEERKMVNGESQLFSPCEEVNVVSSTFSRTESLIVNRKHLTQKIVSLRPKYFGIWIE